MAAMLFSPTIGTGLKDSLVAWVLYSIGMYSIFAASKAHCERELPFGLLMVGLLRQEESTASCHLSNTAASANGPGSCQRPSPPKDRTILS